MLMMLSYHMLSYRRP